MKLTSMGLHARHRGAGMAVACGVIWLLAASTAGWAQPHGAGTAYPHRAPTAQYLMERNAEIALARSAAPPAISRNATVLVLGRHGYQTAIEGRNGFVCMVGRSWGAAFDWPEYWNPRIRAADCLNAAAARYLVPLARRRAELVMAGCSKAQIIAGMKAALRARKLPALGPGAMSYMMARGSYLADGGHNLPHLMFFVPGADAAAWGADLTGSPVISALYWFFAPRASADAAGFPVLRVFLVGAGRWSDGSSAPTFASP